MQLLKTCALLVTLTGCAAFGAQQQQTAKPAQQEKPELLKNHDIQGRKVLVCLQTACSNFCEDTGNLLKTCDVSTEQCLVKSTELFERLSAGIQELEKTLKLKQEMAAAVCSQMAARRAKSMQAGEHKATD